MKLPMSGRVNLLASATCLLLAASGNAQPSTQPSAQEDATAAYKSAAVLRSTTRLVVVDVVATDSNGHPVGDLGIDDFALLEDNQPQKIRGFSFRQTSALNEVQQPANPKVFSNAPRYSGSSSLNVILLDALNAEFLSRTYARDELLKYLES